jgi:hypothetical protein
MIHNENSPPNIIEIKCGAGREEKCTQNCNQETCREERFWRPRHGCEGNRHSLIDLRKIRCDDVEILVY